MNLMICMRGEPEQLPFLTEIAELGAGIELGSYGMIGIALNGTGKRGSHCTRLSVPNLRAPLRYTVLSPGFNKLTSITLSGMPSIADWT